MPRPTSSALDASTSHAPRHLAVVEQSLGAPAAERLAQWPPIAPLRTRHLRQAERPGPRNRLVEPARIYPPSFEGFRRSFTLSRASDVLRCAERDASDTGVRSMWACGPTGRFLAVNCRVLVFIWITIGSIRHADKWGAGCGNIRCGQHTSSWTMQSRLSDL